jgi:hypothetical protein
MSLNAPSQEIRRTRPTSIRDWREAALCARIDGDLFFPVGRNAAARMQTEQAKRICAQCPVREQCLSWAISTGQMYGVLGGLSEDERWELRRPAQLRMVPTDPKPRPQFDRCLNARDWIEEQMARGESIRTIAKELGVGHDALRRARQEYLALEPDSAAPTTDETAEVAA